MIKFLAVAVIAYGLGSPAFDEYRPVTVGAPLQFLYVGVNTTLMSGYRDTSRIATEAVSFLSFSDREKS
jgi:hypothetical protein